MSVIPLHSVVLVVDQIADGQMNCWGEFPEHEVVRASTIKQELTGGTPRQGLNETAIQELGRRMLMKLRLGERVVIDATSLDRNQRLSLANTANSTGVPVFYLVNTADRDLLRGDGVAEVIDARTQTVEPVLPLPQDALSHLRTKWAGITAIGDIHGMHQKLLSALSWARSRNHFVVFLGDVLDYGPATLEVTDEVYRMVMRGEAAAITGNHERKIMRWMDGYRVKLSEGNRTTTRALSDLSESAKNKWMGRFRGLYQNSDLIRQIGDLTFVHGAAHSALWRGSAVDRFVENHAFFGEIDDEQSKPDRPVRSYRWVDAIPTGKVVVVGHDIRSTDFPVVQTGRSNGMAVFLDTGCGKGGPLSSVDFRFTDTGMRLENFNSY